MAMTDRDLKHIRRFLPDFQWQDVERMPYKEEGSAPFKAITRQVLFADPALHCELRYFEMAADGYSTLERHEHAHAVLILRGAGHCLIGNTVRPVRQYDLVSIPAMTWHQFRATQGAPLGFLCMVNATRDKPQLPNEQDRAALNADPQIAAFLNGALNR
jgi:quercetin dioxygenase-like cupin family protein